MLAASSLCRLSPQKSRKETSDFSYLGGRYVPQGAVENQLFSGSREAALRHECSLAKRYYSCANNQGHADNGDAIRDFGKENNTPENGETDIGKIESSYH
jgi:hypothetical protein